MKGASARCGEILIRPRQRLPWPVIDGSGYGSESLVWVGAVMASEER